MAEAATTTTRPARKRATPAAQADAATETKPAARSRAAAKPRPTPEVTQAVDDDGRENYVFVLQHLRDTKTYAVFAPPKSSGCVGSLYMPLGTREVRVRMVGGPAA